MWFGAAFGVVISRCLVLAAGLGAGIITARVLGPEGRGQYFALTTLAAIAAQLSNFGMTSSNVFLTAKNPQAAWPLLVNSAWLSLTVALLAMFAVLIFGDSIAASLAIPLRLLWVVAALSPAILFFTLTCSVLAGEERFAAVNAWQVGNALLAFALIVVAAMIDGSVASLFVASASAAVLSVIGQGVYAGRGRLGRLTFRTDLFSAGWKFASRAYVVLLLGFLMQRLSVAILIMHGKPEDIGMYSIASQMFDVLVIVPSSVAMVIFPGLVKETDLQWRSVRQPLVLTSAIILAACCATAVLAAPFIEIVFGTAFIPATNVVIAVLPGVIFTTITTILSQFVVAKQFPKSLIVVWATGLVCMVAGATLLVPVYGAIGAAIGQSIGSAVVTAGVVALARSQIRNNQVE